LRLRSASEISIAGLVGFRFLLDSGLHVADAATEVPLAAARDVECFLRSGQVYYSAEV
jgi:hypothetical protein